MTVNWFPGHMLKARREIQENAKVVDMVIEVVDARAPLSTTNPDLPHLVRGKPIIKVLNKADLADERETRRFISFFQKNGIGALAVDSLRGKGLPDVVRAVERVYAPLAKTLLEKRQRVRPARIMIAGLPNVGKSSFLNSLAGKRVVKTGAVPGVTRGRQWIRIKEGIELLDTPGVMWPKVENDEQGTKLALLAVVGEKAYEDEAVACYLISVLKHRKPEMLKERYRLESWDGEPGELLEEIGGKRGFFLRGGTVDLNKTARAVLEDFRKGGLGRLTLDRLPDEGNS